MQNINTGSLLKKFITSSFVLLYLVAMLRPITPFVEYAINYDYISKVLCINKDKPELSCKGKCQLMKKLEQQKEDDFNSLQISIKEYPIGFVNILTINKPTFFINILKEKYAYLKLYSYLFTTSTFHPPSI